MAAASWRKGLGVIERLLQDAFRYEFFQAVRLLERHYGDEPVDDDRARRHPVGEDAPPSNEVVRFAAFPSLRFPAGQVDSLSQPETRDGQLAKQPLAMAVSFMGLTGPNGVLPRHYTQMVLARLRERDHVLKEFLDLFNHRSISLFYRAWEKYRLPFIYERAHRGGNELDLFTNCMFALIGFATSGLRGRHNVNDETFLWYSGLFSHRPRTAVSLERMLVDYFGLPIRVEQFCGTWLYLDPQTCSRLAPFDSRRQTYNRLGENTVVGERVWDVQGKFRIVVGPLDIASFRRFMPNGDGLRPLVELTRSFAGVEFEFDVVVILLAEDVPGLRLGGQVEDAPRLGWNTWLHSKPMRDDPTDAVYYLKSD